MSAAQGLHTVADPGAVGASTIRVAICIATYRRPVLLRSLLGSLAKQTLPRHPEVQAFLVVVDNDAGGGAGSVLDEARGDLPFEVIYEIEPVRGIPHARNRAVRTALEAGAQFVAFIDDDEVASANWLDELVDVQIRTDADVVSGPALPRYAPGVPRWVTEGRFFHYPRYRTGTRIHIAATNNVLIAKHVFAFSPEPFDSAFGLSGMDDSHFFMRARDAGARLVWADEALVEEFIPVSKARTRWILQRAYRIGNGYVFCVRDLYPVHRWLLPRVGGAFARIFVGMLLLPFGIIRGRTATVSALRTVANGVGSLVGLFGTRFEEYTVIHGE